MKRRSIFAAWPRFDSRSIDGVGRFSRCGFTLVELLIVVSVLAILAAIVVPRFSNAVDDAKAAHAASSLKTFVKAVERYRIEHDDWPADVAPGVFPPELEPYLLGDDFKNDVTGGSWDYENWYGRGQTMLDGRPIAIAFTLRYGDQSTFLEVDRKLDDGDLSTGNVQFGHFFSPCLIYLIHSAE